MTTLKYKCRNCGKEFEEEYAFEGFFKNEPNANEVHEGQCAKCKEKEMNKIAKEHPESPDLKIECRTDGSVI